MDRHNGKAHGHFSRHGTLPVRVLVVTVTLGAVVGACGGGGGDESDASCTDRLVGVNQFEKLSASERTTVGVDFSGCDLSGQDLGGYMVSGLNLTDARLVDANLQHADLTDTNLTGADLTGADLSYAWLVRANLTDATLDGVTLDHVDLAGAVGLTDAALADALGVEESRLAQAVLDGLINLEDPTDTGKAIRSACRGRPIPDAVAGVSVPPIVVLGSARNTGHVAVAKGKGDHGVGAARFVDVVACQGRSRTTGHKHCGPYMSESGVGGTFIDVYGATMSLRLLDPRQRASKTVNLNFYAFCPIRIYTGDPSPQLDPAHMLSDWLPQAIELAEAHAG